MKKLQEERLVQKECMDALSKEIESELEGSNPDSDLDSDDSDAEPEAADMALLPFFICSATGLGKVHRPGESVLGQAEGFGPACGVQGKRFEALTLTENWGNYALCERCFGKAAGCPELCGYETRKNGELVRCARRCAPEAMEDHPEGHRDLLFGTTHRCSIHAVEKDE